MPIGPLLTMPMISDAIGVPIDALVLPMAAVSTVTA